jgi:hypothetical protein
MSWISALMKINPTDREVKELANQMAHSGEKVLKFSMRDQNISCLKYINCNLFK